MKNVNVVINKIREITKILKVNKLKLINLIKKKDKNINI